MNKIVGTKWKKILRNLAYTKTVLMLIFIHFLGQLIFFISADPRPMLPEYSSVWAALNYGPLGDVVGDVLVWSLAFVLLGAPISIIMDVVAWWRRKRADRRYSQQRNV